MIRRTKSICGKYTAVFEGHHSNSIVIDNKTKIEYKDEPVEKEDGFYSQKHHILGYSAYGVGMDKPNKYFTLRFGDCKEGVKIAPFSGDAVQKEYKAIFRVPRYDKNKTSCQS